MVCLLLSLLRFSLLTDLRVNHHRPNKGLVNTIHRNRPPAGKGARVMDDASQPRLDKFTELTVFLCVVEEGSFSAAARRLERSPSSVSKAISRLEARLQVRLFDRIAGSIRLTQEGHRFR